MRIGQDIPQIGDLFFQFLTAGIAFYGFLQRFSLSVLGAERIARNLPHKILINLIDTQAFYLQRQLIFREPIRVVVRTHLKCI